MNTRSYGKRHSEDRKEMDKQQEPRRQVGQPYAEELDSREMEHAHKEDRPAKSDGKPAATDPSN